MPSKTDRPCTNMVGYGKNGNPDAWGEHPCGAHSIRDCSNCNRPVCQRHLDSGETRQKCMDCYEAENKLSADKDDTTTRENLTPSVQEGVQS